MSSPCFRARRDALLAFAVVYAGLAFLSCSSDSVNSLGSDSDLLGSEPGIVFQDTIGVFSDTTYAFDTPIARGIDLQLGVRDGYERAVILQPGFESLTSTDAQRVVESALLRLVPGSVGGSFPIRIYGFGPNRKYTEGDGVSLDTLTVANAIVDPGTGSIERTVETSNALYPLPPALVQDWIRDSSLREALAMVYTDTVNVRVATFPSKDASDDQPTLQVNYVGGIQRSYAIRDDATTFRPQNTTSNLIVSDGYARRVFLRAELDSLAKDSAVHTARIRFHIVPGTLLGTNTALILYIPDSTDPASADFKIGQRITETLIDDTSTTLEFPMTNALFLVLQGTLKNNGFAIRFKDENTELRQVELYGSSAADSLRPQIYVTSSAPAVFD